MALLLAGPGCEQPRDSSGLAAAHGQSRNDESAAKASATPPAKAPATTPATPGDSESGSPAPPTDQLGAEPRVELRLRPGKDWSVETVGELTLPMVKRGTAFARRERWSFKNCPGPECTLEGRTEKFDAEPPTGKALKADEALAKGFTREHPIDLLGRSRGPNKVTGDAEAGEEGRRTYERALQSRLSPLYCLQFPEAAIGQGATWKSECVRRVGGREQQLELAWTLQKLDLAQGQAELSYAASVTVIEPSGVKEPGKPVSGKAGGQVFFFVEAGAPHLWQEELRTQVEGGQNSTISLSTKTKRAMQFSIADSEPKLRTDGSEFPARAPKSVAKVDGESSTALK